jgi:hypothetical protein
MPIDRRIIRSGFITALGLAVLVMTLPLTLPSPLRTRLAAAVGERFGGTVTIDALRVSIFPRLRVAGDAIVVRPQGRTDVPPLIMIKSFSADANVFGLFGNPLRLQRVHLDGLEINVPPGGVDVDDEEGQDGGAPAATAPLIVEELLSERAMLRILRRTPGKRPREFAIERLAMKDTGANVPWAFTATLTNPTPPGEIQAKGTFGPWNADEPSRTALAANYTFSDADLGVFKGIRGTLRSEGAFEGVLERIAVDGHVDVPDFALTDAGNPVHLRATYRAVVDGTNGNTWLRPVDATFGRTAIQARGGVVEREGEDGRTITLAITMDHARIEDVLKLAVKGTAPLMTGALKLRATLELPPGDVKPLEKLRLLDGSFTLDDARFPSGGVQAKVNDLSQKALGDGGAADEVASDFAGRFVMRDGAIRFSNVTFAVPGARVDLSGVYTVATEGLDFRGTVRLDARLSQLTTGAKAFLLKLVEPLFRRGNVTVVPITINGTVDRPKFGLDVKQAFTAR